MLTNIYKSLNERARTLGIATDLPGINRSERRRNLKLAIKEEKKNKNPIVKTSMRKIIGTK